MIEARSSTGIACANREASHRGHHGMDRARAAADVTG
jgi:hypothetical protein